MKAKPVRLGISSTVFGAAASKVRLEQLAAVLIIQTESRVGNGQNKLVLTVDGKLCLFNIDLYAVTWLGKFDRVSQKIDQNL